MRGVFRICSSFSRANALPVKGQPVPIGEHVFCSIEISRARQSAQGSVGSSYSCLSQRETLMFSSREDASEASR